MFMKSDGSLVPAMEFSGVQAVLSGPAGGVVGIARSAYEAANGMAVIAFDMGGTSTDVSRYDGEIELQQEGRADDVMLYVPQICINTVAAGGGSILTMRYCHFKCLMTYYYYKCFVYVCLRGGIFYVGPESSGACPGPACYGRNGPVSLTDANVVLGRLPAIMFPRVFGPSEDQSIDVDASRAAISGLTQRINDYNCLHGLPSMRDYQVALGYVRVANEAMSRPIISLTLEKGYETGAHILGCFGGAGGLHACSMAKSLKISTIYVHKLAGILSAYGLALADIEYEDSKPMYLRLDNTYPPGDATVGQEAPYHSGEAETSRSEEFQKIRQLALELRTATEQHLIGCGFEYRQMSFKASVIVRYETSYHSLNVPVSHIWNDKHDAVEDSRMLKDICTLFSKMHHKELGFVIHSSALVIEEIRVRGIGTSSAGIPLHKKMKANTDTEHSQVMPFNYVDVWYDHASQVDDSRADMYPTYDRTAVYRSCDLTPNSTIPGPSIICDTYTTVLVEPHWVATVQTDCSVLIRYSPTADEADMKNKPRDMSVEDEEVQERPDPVTLSVTGHRFMSVAEQMGHMLQRVASSTNIKERLDFSCAIFSADGSLVANAPHVPVHLGAMQSAVRYQMDILGANWKHDDVVLCNHPAYGGSHLPDLTVITPVSIRSSTIDFYVASRGHHADIGGACPGSMPPDSTSLKEEGAAIRSFLLVTNNKLCLESCTALFGHRDASWSDDDNKRWRDAACVNGNSPPTPPSRNLTDNINDLKAQVAANARGVDLLKGMINNFGLKRVIAYTQFLQDAAARSVVDIISASYDRIRSRSLQPDGSNDSTIDKQHSETASDETTNLCASVSAEDFMDDGSRIHLSITFNKTDGTALFDFTGCGPQVYGNTNIPVAVTKSAVIYCLRCLARTDIPLNGGCLRPVTIQVPLTTSIVNPSQDAAVVAGNVLTSQRIVDVVLKAFGCCANSYGCMNNITFGDSSICCYETIGGGTGAGPDWDGCSGVQCHMTNTRITDVEVMERRYPVIISTFKIRRESGGEGRHRGGDGIHREYLFLQDGIRVSVLTERRSIPPSGIYNGLPGAKGINLLLRSDDSHSTCKWLSSAINYPSLSGLSSYRVLNLGGRRSLQVNKHDRIVMMTPGGGGYGAVS
eukprot:GHVQ01033638.1.p1 GENE.GHVQ01033638.1~~GHVQ01033638.1.p1  ORF type:complete len:1145 (-),score=129.79 GHVQ01033638.1:1201-4635(-)